jgi:hypothetical protein
MSIKQPQISVHIIIMKAIKGEGKRPFLIAILQQLNG